MAREEADREDLLRDATAYVERAEVLIEPRAEAVFFGFRRDGAASFYVGPDPVYHFNAGRQLRRAYCAGRLIKAEKGRLVALERRRQGGQVHLVRHELDANETAALLGQVQTDLARLGEALGQGDLVQRGQVPAGADVVGRARRWLADVVTIEIARSPRV